MVHQAGAYPGFCGMKRLGIFLPPPLLLDGILVHCRVAASVKFASTHSHTWVERERQCESQVSCPRTQQCPRPGLKLGLLDLKSSALTVRPPGLHCPTPMLPNDSRAHFYGFCCCNRFHCCVEPLHVTRTSPSY